MNITWNKEALGHTFLYNTEFRPSSIPNSGNGWWAKEDIPSNACIRKVSIKDNTLIQFSNAEELQNTQWDPIEYVNYGIGHPLEPTCIFFLNPGTAMNHSTHHFNVRYNMEKRDVMEIWSIRDIKKGEELFNNYSADFGQCQWYNKLCYPNTVVPISQVVKTFQLK